MKIQDLIIKCKDEIDALDEFNRIQVFVFLESISSIKTGKDRNIRKNMEDVLPDVVKDCILHIFLSLLSEYAPTVFSKLGDGTNKFDIDDIFELIEKTIVLDEDETRRCFLSAINDFKNTIFEKDNPFRNFIKCERIISFSKMHNLAEIETAFVLLMFFDENKNIIIEKNIIHDVFILYALCEFEKEILLKKIPDMLKLFERNDLFEAPFRLSSVAKIELLGKQNAYLDIISFDNFCADIYFFSDILKANEENISIVKKYLSCSKKDFCIPVFSYSELDEARIKNLLAHICSDAGVPLFEIKDCSSDIPIEGIIQLVNSRGGILFLDKTNAYKFLPLEKIKCPVFVNTNPFEETFSTDDEENEKFSPEKTVDTICPRKTNLNSIGINADFIWNFKLPQNNNYRENCSLFMKNSGLEQTTARFVSNYCNIKRKPFTEWNLLSTAIKNAPSLTKKEMYQLLESFAPTMDKNKIRTCSNYNPSVLNTSVDLNQVIEEITNAAKWKTLNPENDFSYKVLLYGISGGGKTAWAEYIAKKLNKNLILIHPSDYQRSHVGETERIINALFKRATDTDSILLFDECDSILSSRGKSVYNWELSTTNEIIQQIERFPGILFATTNLREVLDSALDRRFTTKIKFSALKKNGVSELCKTYFGKFNLSDSDINEIHNAGEVCPGDFNVVMSRIKVMNPLKVDAKTIKDILINVIREKNKGNTTSIGFKR